MLIAGDEKLHDFPPESAQRSFLRQAVIHDRIHLRIPSRVDWIELAVMFLADKAQAIGACNEDRHSKLVTALTEAVTNAIVHGNLEIPSALKEDPNGAFARTLAERSSDPKYTERLVDIQMEYDGQRCRWTITDQGTGFDVDKVLARLDSDDPEVILASGRGIMLMKAFLDDVTWSEGGRCCRLMVARCDGEERRTQQRVASRETVKAVPLSDDGQIDWGRAFEAVATDLSQGGIGLLKNGLDTAQRLMIEMQVDGQAVYLPAQVCHLREVGDGIVQIGCRFARGGQAVADPGTATDRADADAAIERLMGHALEAGASQDERRRHPRVALTRPLSITTADRQEHPAVSRDLSKSGMSFVTEFELRKGDLIEVQIDSSGDTPLRMRAQVMRCHRMAANFHDIGVMFLD